ncbi:MAG: bifunctional cobalt-precorrin-7 (C(5))-methyltransferase/cobalt-precorrin-6B (C(15))-methyltransferase, partial [Betaproteobacteria bacterium]|nr:bifunctional cobalt-precorrin-7 (C(5))-methyltransferase/cobalt-precorrin-6B (C(15))-methyltransferase [Betaproteobacteria bacterium]
MNETDEQKTPTWAGHIDVFSCGISFPSDANTLALLENADVVYGSRALLAACPIPLKDARIIAARARDNASEALSLCRAGRRVAVLASG